MRVFICGIEGYLGWALTCHLTSQGHQVAGLDAGRRAQWVGECGSQSAIPISPITERLEAVKEHHGFPVKFYPCDMRDLPHLEQALAEFQPEAVVHLAEMPSAPWSMKYPQATHDNNVMGSLNLLTAIHKLDPSIHLVKLGTMGEYGTPGVVIPEEGPGSFPRNPGSFYHATKVHDSVNTEFVCGKWGLAATDVMQGIVYGTWIEAMRDDPRLATRFDFDECFGTAINRFCAQAVIDAPITPYGKGEQKRGFLPIADSMDCLTRLLATPAAPGEYRVVNQLDEVYSVNLLAGTVQVMAEAMGSMSLVVNISNPRIEMEDHTYEVDTDKLAALGYAPKSDLTGTIQRALNDLACSSERIAACADSITPRITWAA